MPLNEVLKTAPFRHAIEVSAGNPISPIRSSPNFRVRVDRARRGRAPAPCRRACASPGSASPAGLARERTSGPLTQGKTGPLVGSNSPVQESAERPATD
jgi:hypothetical protein